jgi:hypothetical protein
LAVIEDTVSTGVLGSLGGALVICHAPAPSLLYLDLAGNAALPDVERNCE